MMRVTPCCIRPREPSNLGHSRSIYFDDHGVVRWVRVSIEHVFPVSRERYEALYFDEKFNQALGQSLAMGRKLLRLDRDAQRIIRHIYYEPGRDPESPAGQAFGTARAGFTEELDYDLGAHRGAWRTIPNVFTERVRNSGTIELIDLNGAGGGVLRRVRGEVKVALFGFGALVERMIVHEIEKSYAQSFRFTEDWLRAH